MCRIFNLFDCFITDERVKFAPPLFRKVKKSQIIRIIPHYFKQTQVSQKLNESLEEPMEQTDNRVFLFTEMQRRVIFGMLRRVYAIVAECVCEMLTMVQQQTLTSIGVVQKYMGQLLHSQRVDADVEIFDEGDVRRFTDIKLLEFLARELQDNKVIRSAHFSRRFDQVLQIDPCPH